MSHDLSARQLSIGELLSEGWQQFRAHFKAICIITLVIYIPINIILSFFPIGNSLSDMRPYLRMVQFLEGFFGIISTIAIAFLVKSTLDRQQTLTAGEALKKALSKWLPVLGTNIIVGLFVFGLTLLLIVPGIIFAVYWVPFALYAVLFADKFGISALSYSKAMVKGRWWTVCGYSLVLFIFYMISAVIAGIPSGFLPNIQAVQVAANLLVDLSGAFFNVVALLFFLNFDRVRPVANTIKTATTVPAA